MKNGMFIKSASHILWMNSINNTINPIVKHFKEFTNIQLILSCNYHMQLVTSLIALNKWYKILVAKDDTWPKLQW
jgi:hypothetical protein